MIHDRGEHLEIGCESCPRTLMHFGGRYPTAVIANARASGWWTDQGAYLCPVCRAARASKET